MIQTELKEISERKIKVVYNKLNNTGNLEKPAAFIFRRYITKPHFTTHFRSSRNRQDGVIYYRELINTKLNWRTVAICSYHVDD